MQTPTLLRPLPLNQLESAVVAAPDSAAAHVSLGQALRGLGRYADATPHFERATQLEPANSNFALLLLLHRGTWLDEQGQPEEAMACFEQAVREHPDSPDAWATLGTVQAYLSAPEAAENSLRRALQLSPARADLMEHYGRVVQDLRQYENAALVFERLLKLEPHRPLVAGRLLHAKMLTADWTALDRLIQRVEAGAAQGQLSTEPFGLQGFCSSPALLFRATSDYAAHFFADTSAKHPRPSIGQGPRIRIGYVAGEFRNQATSVLLTEVLERHDRERFEVIAFDNGWADGSSLRRRIEAALEIVPIRRVGHGEVAQTIRARGIDVLVNLNGYFGLARTHLFAMRPAPIQVNYLGFPGTLGAPYMDYIVADRIVLPPDEQRFFAEKVVYLPDCYQPNDQKREVASEPSRRAQVGLPDDAFVFCCMNNVYKILPAQFAQWMRLLAQVPGSVLMLYSNVPEAKLNLRAAAQTHGVDGARLVFGEPVSVAEHLARLRLADLFLDTLPYNAHTTGSDALWAGLPVLTCQGTAFAGRVGASLLHAVGLPELVTHSPAEYEALALRLAREPALLAGYRARLAANRSSAPLFDSQRYTRHLEDAYAQMVERARAGQAPAAFSCAQRD